MIFYRRIIPDIFEVVRILHCRMDIVTQLLFEGRHCKKSRKNLSVIPAKAGIHSFQIVKKAWIPFFRGMTTFCSDVLKAGLCAKRTLFGRQCQWAFHSPQTSVGFLRFVAQSAR